MSIALIGLKALIGGLAVVGFLIGQAGHPKRFAGLFSAAPSVAVASLAMTVVAKGSERRWPPSSTSTSRVRQPASTSIR